MPTDTTEEAQVDETPVDGASEPEESQAQEPATLEEALELLATSKREVEAQKRINRNLERRTKKDLKEIERLKAAGSTQEQAEAQVDADKIRADIRSELVKENAIERARDKALYALKDAVNIKPESAVLLMGDTLKAAVGDDGSIDEQAIADAVEELLVDNPGLKVARGDKKFQGDADQGQREASRKSEEQELADQIADAEKARNWSAVISLKQRLAAVRAAKKE